MYFFREFEDEDQLRSVTAGGVVLLPYSNPPAADAVILPDTPAAAVLLLGCYHVIIPSVGIQQEKFL